GRAESVQLFVERARAIEPDFQLNHESARTVAEICARLDGLPLGIELASARLRVLTPTALLQRLEHRLTLLTAGATDRPARHQTLHAALNWSHDLLLPNEQLLF